MQMRYSDGRLDDPTYARKPKYPVLIEALKVFLIFGAFGAVIFYAGYDIANGFAYAYFTLPFFLMPWISTITRRLSRNILIFILVHAVMMCWLLLSPNLVLTTLGVGYMIFLTVYSGVRTLANEAEREASSLLYLFSMLGMVCLCIMGIDRERTGAEWVIATIAFLYSVAYLYYIHFIGVHDALRSTDKEGNFSIRRILKFNNKMLFGYIGIAVLAFVALYTLGLGNLLAWLGSALKQIVKYFGMHLEFEEDYLPVPKEESGPKWEELPPMVENAEASPFWLMLQAALEIALAIGLVAFVVYALYYIIKRFSQVYQYKEKNYEETKVFYKSVPRQKQKRRSWRTWIDNSPENKIRRAYYRKVKGQMGKKVQLYETPAEVAEVLPEIQELVGAYEKARYSEEA